MSWKRGPRWPPFPVSCPVALRPYQAASSVRAIGEAGGRPDRLEIPIATNPERADRLGSAVEDVRKRLPRVRAASIGPLPAPVLPDGHRPAASGSVLTNGVPRHRSASRIGGVGDCPFPGYRSAQQLAVSMVPPRVRSHAGRRHANPIGRCGAGVGRPQMPRDEESPAGVKSKPNGVWPTTPAPGARPPGRGDRPGRSRSCRLPFRSPPAPIRRRELDLCRVGTVVESGRAAPAIGCRRPACPIRSPRCSRTRR